LIDVISERFKMSLIFRGARKGSLAVMEANK